MKNKAKRVLLVVCSAFLLHSSLLAQSYGDYAVTVDVTGNGYAHSTIIYFDDESWDINNPPTYGWDPCCDANSLGVSFPQPQVYTEVVAPPLPPTNQRLSINGLPHVFEETNVPMGFAPGELAEYLFSFTELYTIPEGITVELIDLAQNVTQDLLVDSTYLTWSAPSDDEARFIVRFIPSAITGVKTIDESDSLRIVMLNERLRITQMNMEQEYDLLLVDVQGRVIINTHLSGQQQYTRDMSGLSKGVYIANIVDGNGVRTVRRIVR